MVFGLVAMAFLMSTGDDPLDTALARTEPPISLRAAFTVELTDGEAYREIRYDPRLIEAPWQVITSEGKSHELDLAVEEWGSDVSPDGWLFADDLRASMGRIVEAEDMGAAWLVHFQHQLSENDGPLDAWAAEHLAGSAWLEPVGGYFLRIDYDSFEAFDGPKGGQIESYSQNYLFRQDPEYGISYIWAYEVDMKGSYLGERIDRSYRMQVTDVKFFFASTREEALYRSRRMQEERGGEPLFVSAH